MSDTIGVPLGGPRRAQLHVCPDIMPNDFYGTQPLSHFVYSAYYLNDNETGVEPVDPELLLPAVWEGDPADAPAGYQDIRAGVTDDPRSDVNYASSSSFGALLREPRSRLPDDGDLSGWLPLQPGCTFGAEELPEQCPDGVPDRTTNSDFRLPPSEFRVRELVRDPRFLVSRGIIRNAQDLYSVYPDPKAYIDDPDLANWFGARIAKIASAEFIDGGVWRRTSEIRIRGAGETPLLQATSSGVADPLVDYSSMGAKDAELAIEQRAKELALLPRSRQAAELQYFSQLQGGTTALSEAYAVIPSTAGLLWQELDLRSLQEKTLLVRVDLQFTDSTGKAELTIGGDSLSKTLAVNGAQYGTRQVTLAFEAQRSAAASRRKPDEIRIQGAQVNVYGVSVTAVFPVDDPNTGKFYEVVVAPHGADWRHAERYARSRFFKGRQGRLAIVKDEKTLDFILERLRPDVDVWIGAWAKPGDDAFRWIDETDVVYAPWDLGEPAEATGYARYLYVKRENGKWGASKPIATREGLPIGYIVEY